MKKHLSYLVLFFILLMPARGWAFTGHPDGNDIQDVNAATVAGHLMTEIENNVQAVSDIIDGIVKDLNAGHLEIESNSLNSNPTLEDRLKLGVTLADHLLELGFAFEPAEACSGRRLFARAYRIEHGRVVTVPLDEIEDYVPENGGQQSGKIKGWFSTILPATRGIWMKPDLDSVSDRVSVRYGRPFQIPEDEGTPSRQGVVYAVWSIEGISHLLKDIELGANGYANLQTKDGDFLVHFNRDCIFKSSGDSDKDYCDAEDTASADFVSVRMPSTEWVLTVKKDTQPVSQELRRHLFHKTIAVIFFLAAMIILFILVFSFIRKNTEKWHNLSAIKNGEDTAILLSRSAPDKTDNTILLRWRMVVWVVSVSAFLASISMLTYYYAWPNVPETTDKMLRVDNKHRLDTFWKQHQERVYKRCQKLPIAVPTGIFIQSMTFVDAYSIRLTGHIWQKYTDGVHDGISRGFILPESEETSVDHLYTQKIGDTEVWGWRFNVVVYQEFDYLRYPFGSEDIWIQIWHKDFYSNVVLIPDYDSYKLILPNLKPGIREGLEIPGWDIQSTFFGYLKKDYDTNFGQTSFDGVTAFPELYFNVMIKKQIMAPLVSYLLPVIFLWGMMYAILLLSSRYKLQAESYGFNAMNVVTACAGFFLVVVFCHVDLRRYIVSKEINYLEYYYFMAYLLIVFVISNAIILTLSKFGLTHYKNNLIPKILYWPALGVIIFIITLRTFY